MKSHINFNLLNNFLLPSNISMFTQFRSKLVNKSDWLLASKWGKLGFSDPDYIDKSLKTLLFVYIKISMNFEKNIL